MNFRLVVSRVYWVGRWTSLSVILAPGAVSMPKCVSGRRRGIASFVIRSEVAR